MDGDIRIIGSISGKQEAASCIAALLTASEESLTHGGDFTGKPITSIKASATHILKLHMGGGFSDEKIATSWVMHNLEKNRQSGLYHPDKTWFLIEQDQTWHAGNITPRMQPLHVLIEQCGPAQAMSWLIKVCKIYISHAANFQDRLDEGLSNFGLADDNRLYYLDDDFYTWDHFLSFTHMLAGWFRHYSGSWLDETKARELGRQLSSIIHEAFDNTPGIDSVHVVYEHLGSQFLHNQAQVCAEHCRQELMEASHNVQPESSHKSDALHPHTTEVSTWLNEDEPIGVLADVHANLPALRAVLEELDRQNIQRIMVAGDIVGYGPHPAECIELLSERGAACLRGNHDHIVGTGVPVASMQGSRLIAAEWTINHLDEHYKRWLTALPLQWRFPPWIAMHGAPMDPTFFNAYIYDRTAERNLQWLQANQFDFCLHGHSHLQGIYWLKQGNIRYGKGAHDAILHKTSLICPGSVGQPRGGIPGAEFAILRPTSHKIQMRIIDYDLDETIRDMRRHRLPGQLMQRLRNGI